MNRNRMKTFFARTAWLAFLLAFVALLAPRAQAGRQTALDRYVAQPDPNYGFRLLESKKGSGFTTFFLEMTSQSWLTTNEVDRTLWKHLVRITRPDTVASSTALLFIQGG